ncbi:MAG TPA: LuxR C-terminal-related transcriptional regulator [Gemmatimonadales bacterium]|nr:LuxR C-terminal-related transcriptional regulator [Gemmatimonadales bacterium]
MQTLSRPFTFDPPLHTPPATRSLLTPRQREVVHLIAEGLTNKEIASRLNIALHTVKTHVHAALMKLRVQSRLELAVMVHRANREAVSEDERQAA